VAGRTGSDRDRARKLKSRLAHASSSSCSWTLERRRCSWVTFDGIRRWPRAPRASSSIEGVSRPNVPRKDPRVPVRA
jgi:hypothetical protein